MHDAAEARALGLGEGAHGGLRRVHVERLQRLQAVGVGAHERGAVLFPALRDRGRVVVRHVCEQVAGVGEVAGEGEALAEQVGRRFDARRRHVAPAGADGRRGAARELGRRQRPEVLRVEPLQLGEVDLYAGGADAVQRERLGHLVDRHELLLGAGVPAQEGQKVDDGLGLVAGLAVLRDVDRDAERVGRALGELAARRRQEERQVRHDRRRPAERAVEQHVLGHRREPLLAADDVRDAHRVVVDHVREVVGGHAVALDEHLVVHLGRVEAHVAADGVLEGDRLALGDEQADHVRRAGVEAALHLVGRERQAVGHLAAQRAVVRRRRLGRGVAVPRGLDLVGRVEGEVGRAVVQQAARGLGVALRALRLAVRPGVAAGVRPLVRDQARPGERLADVGLRLGHEARAVGVLDAEHERALAGAAREQDVVERRPEAPDVEQAGGAGREADADGVGHGSGAEEPPS